MMRKYLLDSWSQNTLALLRMTYLRSGLLTMKKPRVSDFDPNAAPPLKSSMDSFPMIQKPPVIPIEPQIKNELPETREKNVTEQKKSTSNRDTVVSRYHDTMTSLSNGDVFEIIRKEVKQ